MSLKDRARDLMKIAACLSVAGMVLSSSCGSNELDALIVGIEAAAAHLDRDAHNDDISFGEWLLSELDD